MPHKLDTEERVCFYEQEFYVLSNFSSFKVEWKGILFDTAEAVYHWEKFEHVVSRNWNGSDSSWKLTSEQLLLPERATIQRQILNTRSAHDAFTLAQKHKELRRPDWDDVKVGIMLNILRSKVQQHEYVRRKLLETGDRELVEDSWRDDFWGWGPNKDGQNMLGKLWMRVREEVRNAD